MKAIFLQKKYHYVNCILLYNYAIKTLVKWEDIEIQRIGIEMFYSLNYEQ